MVIIERQIQMVRSGKWAELEELDKKFAAVESGLAFRPRGVAAASLGDSPLTRSLLNVNGKVLRYWKPLTKRPL